MYCKNCGAEINDNSVICAKCGAATTQTSHNEPGVLVPAPKKTETFIFGLLGFVLTGFPIIGLVLSCIGVSLAAKSNKQMQQNPQNYEGVGYVTAGKILGIAGIVFGALYLLWVIIAGVILGSGFFAWFDFMSDALNL